MRRPVDLDSPRARAVLARARAVPPGRIAAYSDLDPAAPRFAGAVIAAGGDPTVPWHRIVRADGSLTQGERQARLLEAEGVPLTASKARVDVRVARWADDVASA